MNILITGGLGFIGGHFLTKIKLRNQFDKIIVFDKMTYASNYNRVKSVFENKNFLLVKGDVFKKESKLKPSTTPIIIPITNSKTILHPI